MKVQVVTGLTSRRDAIRLTIETDQIKLIEWTDSSDKKWLMNHLHWAMNNNHAVAIRPAVTFESN